MLRNLPPGWISRDEIFQFETLIISLCETVTHLLLFSLNCALRTQLLLQLWAISKFRRTHWTFLALPSPTCLGTAQYFRIRLLSRKQMKNKGGAFVVLHCANYFFSSQIVTKLELHSRTQQLHRVHAGGCAFVHPKYPPKINTMQQVRTSNEQRRRLRFMRCCEFQFKVAVRLLDWKINKLNHILFDTWTFTRFAGHWMVRKSL